MTDKVALSWIFNTDVAGWFAVSVADLVAHDAQRHRYLHEKEYWRRITLSSGPRIAEARCEVIDYFAKEFPDADWLLMLDADMTFERTLLDDLMAVADPEKVPIVGGLCFTGGRENKPSPTIYRLTNPDHLSFETVYDYPRDQLVKVDATGAACLLMHRQVLAAMEKHFAKTPDGRRNPYPWFAEGLVGNDGERWGEDTAFCVKAAALGIPVHVHTGVKLGHQKTYLVDEIYYDGYRVLAAVKKNVVVIPMKNRLALTRDLVTQLRQQGDVDEIIVCDNGSGREAKNWLSTQDDITVLDCPDVGIHVMWNRAIDYALERHDEPHVAFLNNDLRLGPEFIKRLSRTLDHNPAVTAVCGNYDGRTGEGLVETRDICAGRYDGAGGFAGFAFMVRGKWFETGYRFPETCDWWFGDNDLLTAIDFSSTEREPKSAAIVLDAEVEHLDGGGKTAGDPGWSDPRWDEMKRHDREAFERRWTVRQVELEPA